jgi:predicted amidohydrolase
MLVRTGLVQLQVRTNRTEDNLARAAEYLGRAAAEGCQLVVLPEAFSTGLNLPKSRQCATTIPGPGLEWLTTKAAELRIHLVAGLLEEEGGAVYSSVVLIDSRGTLLHTYRRMNIYDLEAYFLTPGRECRVVETELGRIGIIAGYDVQFPETFRLLFAQGVEIAVCPSLLLRPFAESIRQMAIARAAENCCYFLFCSATGENTLAGLTYMGNSMILQSPVGIRPYSPEFRRQEPFLAEARTDEKLLVGDLDLALLRRLQVANPLFRDFKRSDFFHRMPSGYQRWDVGS